MNHLIPEVILCHSTTLRQALQDDPFSRVSANADCMAADCMALFTCDRSLIEMPDDNDQEMRPNTFLHIVNLGVWN